MNAIHPEIGRLHDTFQLDSSFGPISFMPIEIGNNDRHLISGSALFPSPFFRCGRAAMKVARTVKHAHTRRTETPPQALLSSYNFLQQSCT
ncbi:hypothetical protein [Burkholderia sp. SIMBA_062]|uniref:hypothetical protein n=1 Tax=Burkholderia sp. SIMBA_062 TaxID=3085803 RepID=UPI0039791AA4